MSNSKGYNSIVFLTTLYLGLVLVGGAPPILTQAALTQRIEIQNEIETEDDLDKKPDEESGDLSEGDFPTLFARLLLEIKEESQNGNISLPSEFYIDGKFTKSQNSGGGGIGGPVSDQNLSLLLQSTVNQKFRPKAFELADSVEETKIAKIRLEANSADFLLKVSFSKNNADHFAAFLNREFSFSADLVRGRLLKQIYENTKAASENNQVFIVTRLPRASIDDFLAENNAQ
ncbi:MAG TPA: hypothetical protein VK892_08470 [Pyrinomonadaceae bacterium]|nr:hypothetical protein [Pyrinomonadaceae bacterium]